MNQKFRATTGRAVLYVLALLLSYSTIPCALAGPTRGPGAASFPQVSLPEISRGQNAVAQLGAHLPGVANAYGLNADQLVSLLRGDLSLAIDRGGRLLYTDPKPEPGDVVNSSVPPPSGIPLADTFKLHSRAGAKRIIYLDFNGHVLSGTAWNAGYNGGNNINAPAFDIDGLPGSFSNTELTIIQEIWRRVAEDYAPFEVDVTTELSSESQITRSSSSDEFYGTRVLISPISSFFGSYGGIAYVGAFDDVGDFYKPALVFPENLGPNGAKFVAEAVSHEAGHNLGLNHDGTASQGYYTGQGSGETGWAPIMGVGYYQNVSQWSKGEYSGANNTQDDLAIIQNYGLPYRTDDHGNTAETASMFPTGTQLSGTGVIERSSDVDVFGFTTGAGLVSISINPSGLGPNLDILAELRGANGSLIASSNPSGNLSASFVLTLGEGTYYLHLRGTGAGSPTTTGYSSYGSLGQYWISGTVVAPTTLIPPVANFVSSTTSGTAPLSVSFDGSSSFDQDGWIVSHYWTFGDGGSANGANVTYIYNTPGTYNAVLTVMDNSGFTATKTVSIQVNAVPSGNSFVTGKTLGRVRNDWSGFVGMSFRVGSSPITVSALGRIYLNGNSGMHVVKLVNAANGTDVPGGSVSIAMSGGTAGEFKYANLASSVVLAANTTYYLASQETYGGDTWYDLDTSITTAAVATQLSGIYTDSGSWWPGGSAGYTYGPVDFKYTGGSTTPTTRNLTVASSNPGSGVAVSVSPADNNGAGNGSTTFTRTYNDGAVVTLTAPSTASGNNFQKWQKNGVDLNSATTVNVTMDGNHTLTAVYATPAPAQTIFVQSIVLSIVNSSGGKSVRAVVRVTDTTGASVAGATVSGTFDSVVSGTVTGTTDTSGNATLTSRKSKKGGTVTFTVNNVTKSGASYDPTRNLKTSTSISFLQEPDATEDFETDGVDGLEVSIQ